MQRITKIVIAATLMVGAAITNLSTPTYASLDSKNVQAQQDHRRIIEKTEQLARQGKTINSENFAVGSKGEDIQNKWGKPDSNNSSEEAYTYSKRNIEFFLSKGIVTHIVSYDTNYKNITYNEVIKTLGEPAKETRGEDGVYATYECGKKLLMFSFYYDKSGKNPDTIKQIVVLDQYKNLQEEKQYHNTILELFDLQ
ncbi:DUF4309 domain-containing protein [Shimazuella kribbensis]|uniref:DUF4309 domain-containing protein n=1 Tax=Shimazuella kribbensis TaxID=139808 RepID=UPI00048C39A0|nr:DUF4309 domain-containing protein [Shimazuella kribbensis]